MTWRAYTLTDAERLRVARIDELVAIGGVPELIEVLSDPSWTVRRAAVAGLASLGDDAVGPLCAWLQHARTSEHAIAAAVDALATSLGTTTNRQVLPLLAHATPAIAADAAQILGRRRAVEATADLTRALAHPDDNVAVAAIEALGVIGGRAAVDALIALVEQRTFFRTFPALQVLSRTGDPRAIPALAALLADDTYRLEALRALGRTGLAQAVPPIATILERDPASTRVVALALADLLARAEWGGADEHVAATLRTVVAPAIERFLAALPDGDASERAAITAVLGVLGDAAAVPTLARLLEDPALRAAATAAIQRIGRTHDDALLAALDGADTATCLAVLPVVHTLRAAPAVRALLDGDDAEVRARACEALARIGDTAAVPALFDALADPSPRVAHAATAAIHSLGVADTGRRAIAALRSDAPVVRRHALRIIGYMGFGEAFDAVSAAVADPDARVAELAVTTLGALPDPRADAVLAGLRDDPREVMRAAAARATARRPTEAAHEQLERALGDAFPWVRYYACQGLGRVGRAQATNLLIERLADPAPQVRVAAIEALAHLDTPAAWQALCAAVGADDADARRAALVGIGLRPREAALPYLLEAMASDDVATRLIALSGLARRSEPAALEALADAAVGDDAEVRDAALSLLGDRDDAPAAEVVVHAALHVDPEHPVQRTLSRPGAARIHAIATRLRFADDRAAPLLAAALGRMRSDAATRELFAALAFDNPAARRAAASVLVAIGADGARAAVVRLATDDPDPDVRRVCAAATAE